LLKTTEIDDLLGDTYGMIWREIGAKLRREKAAILPAPIPAPALPMAGSPHRPDSRDAMALSHLMHVDGASDVRPSSAHYGSTSSPYMPRPATPPPHAPALPPLQELTPGKPKSRVVSRREMIKRASDTVASLKPTASTMAAAAAANKTGSPPPPDSVGRRGRREAEDTSASIVMGTETGANSDDCEGEGEEDVRAGSGTASREDDAHERRDGNDADDESGSELSGDEEGDEDGKAGEIEDVVMDVERGERHVEAVVGARESGGFSGANSLVDGRRMDVD